MQQLLSTAISFKKHKIVWHYLVLLIQAKRKRNGNLELTITKGALVTSTKACR